MKDGGMEEGSRMEEDGWRMNDRGMEDECTIDMG